MAVFDDLVTMLTDMGAEFSRHLTCGGKSMLTIEINGTHAVVVDADDLLNVKAFLTLDQLTGILEVAHD